MAIRCEVFVNNYLPIIRKNLTIILYREFKISQLDIAKKLKISQAAVSQYLSGNRAKGNIEFDQEVMNILYELAKNLANNTDLEDNTNYVCKICTLIFKEECRAKLINR